MLGGRRRRRAEHERGAVAVEAAIVTPVVLLMMFGVLEFSLALRDYVSVSSAVRTAARVASTNGSLLAGNGTCEAAGPDLPSPPPCSPSRTPAFAQLAAQAIQTTGTAMPMDSIDYILVYKANEEGFPGSDGNTTMPGSVAECAALGASTPCVAYVWQDSRDAFRYAGGAWTAGSVDACPATADSIGIFMRATHRFASGIFGSSIGIGDRAVMRVEPVTTALCGPGSRG